MRRFNLRNRIKRCRNMCFTSDGEGVPQFGGRHESECSLENCEVTFDRDISAELRSYILDQTELYCKMCGICPGDIDDLTGYRAKFNIEFIADTSIGGQEELSNLRTLCSTCDEGMKSIVTVKPTAIWLLSQVRRAGHDEQLAVLKWLREKFKV